MLIRNGWICFNFEPEWVVRVKFVVVRTVVYFVEPVAEKLAEAALSWLIPVAAVEVRSSLVQVDRRRLAPDFCAPVEKRDPEERSH